ncbi:unnamed protein product [Microthlaspi erraticum]|uniref:Uncharacterized protein n=1 Tax=Microthlaspi erraticum TaxID=1685480 RepID=A0A6D2JTG8_9BRAS|nr:unnamed protein product [Microthlaspi erraticum]
MEHLVLDKVDHSQLDLKVVVLHWWWNNPLSLLVAVWSISLTNRSSLPSSTESIPKGFPFPSARPSLQLTDSIEFAYTCKKRQKPSSTIEQGWKSSKQFRLERARVEKPRSDRPRAERLVQAPCVLDEESLQALFDEPLGRALQEGEDAASKARPGDKRKDPPAQAPSVKPSQLTMTLFPTKFENGKIEYKIRYKGRSRPFSRAKALVTSEQSRDPTKLKELLSQVLTITLDGGTSSTNA